MTVRDPAVQGMTTTTIPAPTDPLTPSTPQETPAVDDLLKSNADTTLSPSSTTSGSSSSTLHGKAAEERINILREEIGIVKRSFITSRPFLRTAMTVNTSIGSLPLSPPLTPLTPSTPFDSPKDLNSLPMVLTLWLKAFNPYFSSSYIRFVYRSYLTNQPTYLFAPVGIGPCAKRMVFFDLARKTTSLKHLEQLAQELPRLSPSGRPLSMSSTMSSVPSSPVLTMAPNPLSSGDAESSTPVTAAQSGVNGITSPTSSSDSPMSNTSSSPSSTSSYQTKGTSNMSIDANIARTNWATTSHVIEHLQQTIDALRRDLNEQTARAVEEKQGRDAIRKRCDKIESQLEGLRHQNETLNSIITRKERRLKELEKEAESRLQQVENLENDQKQYIESKNKHEALLTQIKDDKERSEAAYKAVVEGTKAMRMAYEEKFTAIGQQIKKLAEERTNDKERIAQLQNVVEQQKAEREQMEQIKGEMELQRKQHIREIQALMEKFQVNLETNNSEAETKVKETMLLVSEMKKTHLMFASQMGLDTTK